MHHDRVEDVAESLCYYTNMIKEKKHILSDNTRGALQTKVDPNMSERERKSIQALLYTGGGKSCIAFYCDILQGSTTVVLYLAFGWLVTS